MSTATQARPDVIERLTVGIAQLTSSEAWTHWLDTQSRFHQYSMRNCILIAMQRPNASRVAGFRTWLGLGRHVRKGEKGIAILAPCTRKVETDDVTTGETVATRMLTGFKPAYVFDIAQTDGDDLPEAPLSKLNGDDADGAYTRLVAVAHALGYTVEEDHLDGSRNGDCTFSERRVRIEVSNDPAQQVKTLAHEIAHAILHESFDGSRDLAELEAESVAYIVCSDMGLDSSAYSFGYVAGWAGGGDEAIKGIQASGQRIATAAHLIIGHAEGATKAVA